MDSAYLTYRSPLPVNSSYYFGLSEQLCTVEGQTSANHAQAYQAARVCLPLVEEALRIHDGQVPPDSIRGKPLCMAANRSLFGTCRMPTAKRDTVFAAYSSFGAAGSPSVGLTAAGHELQAAKACGGEAVWLEDVTQWSAEGHQQDIESDFSIKDASSGAPLGTRHPCPWVVVLRRGRTFRVQVASASKDGSLVAKSVQQLTADFMQVLQCCPESSSVAFSPAALTAGHRDSWTAQWAQLKAHGSNEEYMNTVIGALMVVCLDDTTISSAAQLSAAGLHGTLPRHSASPWAHNRWWDKTCQVVVAPPSTVTYAEEKHGALTTQHGSLHCPTLLIWEHSMSDGHVSYCMLSRLIAAKSLPTTTQLDKKYESSASSAAQELQWSCPSALESRLKASAAAHFAGLLGTQDIQTSIFASYGANTIKKFKCSPDAWAQVAFQIAAMRTEAVLDAVSDWGNAAAVGAAYAFWDTQGADIMACDLKLAADSLQPVPQYEPVQMRGFRRGRTECARGASIESLNAGRALHRVCDMAAAVAPETDVCAAWHALQSAIQMHSATCRHAAAGKSFDRHLFGLKKIAGGDNPEKKVMPETLGVLSAPALAAASDWRVSTSNLSGGWLKAWGWGQVTAAGVGVAYSTLSAFGKDALMLHIAALNKEHVSGAQCYRPRARVYLTEVVRALRQMRLVAELGSAHAESAGAKL